ncbi:MAG: tRNA pseudouridine(55) synthase TruB [Vigna little leaf phytoplasma]|nr:tRNA pseudouridine(55) synthase TruB [Vigna little leaf phytoplasma]
MNGVFFINKQKGMTSYDVVRQIKKKFGLLKVGHTGTLDPLAEGLLLILVGKATKLNFLFSDLDKQYTGTIIFNRKYDTLDIEGKLLAESDQLLQDNMIQTVFGHFHQQKYWQIPPIYSALKFKGQRLYHLARKNMNIIIPPRKVCIYRLIKTSYLQNDKVDFFAHVSKGTYIRSLANDIAQKLNTYGAIAKLCRTAIGFYPLSQAQYLNQITLEHIIPVEKFFQNYPKIILNDYLINLVKNGIYLDERQISTHRPFVVLNKQEEMIAYYEVVAKYKYAPKYYF